MTPALDGSAINPFTMAVAFFVCGFGNIVNDILDIKIDRVNRPDRVLPSGRMDIMQARRMAHIFLIISLVLLIWLNTEAIIMVIAAIILLLLYNFRLKHRVFMGNLTIAVLGGAAFLLGGTPAGWSDMVSLPGPLIPAVFAFLMHLGREILKDIEDTVGDKKGQSITAPIKLGGRQPLILSHFVFITLIAASIWVYLEGWFNWYYLVLTVIGVDLPLIIQIIRVGLRPDPAACGLAAKMVKLEMLPGLVSLIIGKNF